VREAVQALDAGDAGAAVSLLEAYLSTGKCENGSIGTPESIRSLPNAAFDLGLGLFTIAERFGRRFGEDPPTIDGGLSPNDEAELAKRSTEVDCALRIVRLVAGDVTQPVELRARAFYLAANLDFLRRDYRTAVESYDQALRLVPGVAEDAGDGIGRDAAYNRAIALRRIEDEERDAGPPDAGPDSGEPDSGPPDAGDEPDAGNDEQKDGGDDGQEDGGDGGGESGPPDAGPPDGGVEPQPQEQQKQSSANQDDRLLDLLEQAPTLQEHDAKRHAAEARGRPGMEDK
jgi:hypothetical protein